SGGVPSDAYAFNLTTTENNAVVYSAVAMKGRTHAPGVGFTERAEIKQVGGGLTSSVAVEDKIVAAAGTPQGGINGSFSGTADWAEVALEIKPLTPGPAIVHEETQTGGSSSATAVATSANLTGVSGNLYLAAISTQPRKSVVSVTGLGLTWTLVKNQCSGLNTTGVEVWKAQGTPSGNGVVTATLASASTATVITVSRYSGVDAMNPIGSVISGNTNGANASAICSGGVPSNSYALNLTTTVNGAVVYSAAAMKGRTHTPGAGYTERAEIKEVGGGLTSSIAVEDKIVAAAGTPQGGVNGSFSGTADWAEVGLEIKPQATMGPAKRDVVIADDKKLAVPPSAYRLEQNYPNPFNPSTMIDFALPAAGKVTVNIYNETGQLVRKLVDGEMSAGRHAVRWNGRNQLGKAVAAGIYLYRIVVHGEDGNIAFTQTRRMTFLK
ncbi:MAG: FlgD immunoglobulin-like domain containing protein, partial [bacterium]